MPIIFSVTEKEFNEAFTGMPVKLSRALSSHKKNPLETSSKLLEILDLLMKIPILTIGSREKDSIELLCRTIGIIFVSNEFTVPHEHAYRYVSHNPLIANLFSITSMKNTDYILEGLIKQNDNLIKILTLYSSRNNFSIITENIFKANPVYASWWYGVTTCVHGTSNSQQYEKIKGLLHFRKLHEYYHLRDAYDMKENPIVGSADFNPYFYPSYVDHTAEPYIKGTINAYIKKHNDIKVSLAVSPDMRKIAVISTMMLEDHAVYKCIGKFFSSLKGHYHVTLFYLGPEKDRLDHDMFDEVQIIKGDGTNFNIHHLASLIKDGKYGTVIFPEIGTAQSIIVLSNMRFASIQISMYGHPVSTWGSEIDYFIGGRETELLENPEINYSERLVLIPGMGMYSPEPQYTASFNKKETEEIIINFNWGTNKFNYAFLDMLSRIFKKTSRKLILDFISLSSHNFQYIPLKNDLKEIFKAPHIEVDTYHEVPYQDYMKRIERCDFSIDAYPWGGYNRIIDLIHLEKPVAVMEGTKAYNRLASGLYRVIGLEDLIGNNEETLTAIILRLIENDNYRNNLKQKIRHINEEKIIYKDDKGQYFKKAIDFIIENHDSLKQDKVKKPVVIS